MKILIITASAGAGHNHAADAIAEYLKINHPETQIKKIDLTDYIGFCSRWFYFKSYNVIIKYCPWFWNFWYNLTENKITGFIFWQIGKVSEKLNSKKLFKEIDDFAPNKILCTHFTPPDIIFNFYNKKIDIATVVTDYLPCRLWACSPKQKYFVGHNDAKLKLIKNQIPEQNIIISGLPIKSIFYNLPKKEGAEQKNILIMPVPIGKINLKKLTSQLAKNFPNYKINIICGTNKNQKDELRKYFKENENIKIYGFVENQEIYINEADIIFSKAGGITITEILFLKKPLIIINPIPGQETQNTNFLLKNNFACYTKNYIQAIDIAKNIINKEINLNEMDLTKNPMEIIWEEFLIK